MGLNPPRRSVLSRRPAAKPGKLRLAGKGVKKTGRRFCTCDGSCPSRGGVGCRFVHQVLLGVHNFPGTGAYGRSRDRRDAKRAVVSAPKTVQNMHWMDHTWQEAAWLMQHDSIFAATFAQIRRHIAPRELPENAQSAPPPRPMHIIGHRGQPGAGAPTVAPTPHRPPLARLLKP